MNVQARQCVKEVWWSIDDNVILFSKPAGERAYHYMFDMDFWLPGEYERKLFARIVEEYYGVRYGDNRLLLFVRARLGEYAVNVYGEGLRLGVLEFRGRSWILYATGALASILKTLGAETFYVNTRRRLKGKKVKIEANREHVLVETDTHVGPAVRVGEGLYKVRDMAPKGFKLLESRKDWLKNLIERNVAHLKLLENEAIGFAKRVEPVKGEKVYVAFSGGADSTATLLIAVEAFGASRVVAVYADTGLEFRQVREYVEKVASMLGVDLIVVEANGVFWDEVLKEGPPTRDRRWCTARLKINTMKSLLEVLKPRLILEGVRCFESRARLSIGAVSKSPVASTARRAFPIYDWSRLEVQLYLLWKGVELNPLYDLGFTRLGCVVCPAMHLFELEISKRINPAVFEAIYERFAFLVGRDITLSGGWRRL